ncbi:hypothetical protein [Alcanivorax sp.]|uniref:hypothetical protein n=1 Tax=Alcanivorax sp. TaxID=1872427 RepID=UPI0032D8C12D
MRFSKLTLFSLLFCTSVSADVGRYVLVEENTAEVNHAGVQYLLNTYIVMFEQPYYITVERVDEKVVDLEVAEKIAVEYIKPRGCTEPLKRRKDLDQKNDTETKIVIGVAC